MNLDDAFGDKIDDPNCTFTRTEMQAFTKVAYERTKFICLLKILILVPQVGTDMDGLDGRDSYGQTQRGQM